MVRLIYRSSSQFMLHSLKGPRLANSIGNAYSIKRSVVVALTYSPTYMQAPCVATQVRQSLSCFGKSYNDTAFTQHPV
jgi:hypothetical protein